MTDGQKRTGAAAVDIRPRVVNTRGVSLGADSLVFTTRSELSEGSRGVLTAGSGLLTRNSLPNFFSSSNWTLCWTVGGR